MEMKQISHLFIAGVLLLLPGCMTTGPQEPATKATEQTAIRFDGYRRGVPLYQLELSQQAGAPLYTLRRRNPKDATWGQDVSAPGAEIAGRQVDFRLNGALAGLIPVMQQIAAVNWQTVDAASWQDSKATYVRHARIARNIGGQDVAVTRWAQKDATDPMDLLIADDGALIAAIDVNDDTVLVRRGYEAFTNVAAWQAPGVSQPLYGYQALDLLMMPTRDGERLATRVYLPKGAGAQGPFPTILVRNPYGISDLLGRYEQYVVKGYAVVLQAVRGTAYWDPESRSEGTARLQLQEPEDGADTLDWITRQPWSNGSICMQGLSYHGFTQWAAAMARNPALKCVVSESTLGTAFGDQPYMGGTLIQGTPFYLFWMFDRKLLPGRTWSDVLRHRPIRDLDVYATGAELPAWRGAVTHWKNDEYWQPQDWFRDQRPRDFAALEISGWFDDDFPGTRSTWAMMSRYGTKPNRLIVGPWKHSYNHDRALNGYAFGANALRDDIWLTKQKWYDHYLKGMANGVTDKVVDYFVLGSNEWRQATAWPPAEAQPRAFYLHSDGTAARNSNAGTLMTTAPAAPQPADAYRYDPDDPPRNWYNFDLMGEYADVQTFPYDFKDIEDRGDVVTYTSAPLDADLTIAGDVKLILYASTDVKDTDWWAHISDVDTDNRSNRLTMGVIRARFRKLDDPDTHVFGENFTQSHLLSGRMQDVVRYEISLKSIANTFRKGHRIRIAVMNAMDNYSFPNSNTGGIEAEVTETRVGRMRIHHAPGAASHVILPVMPQ